MSLRAIIPRNASPFARFLGRALPALALFAVAGCLAVGCMDGGGSGSETTLKGLAGRVVDAEGRPVAGAAVYIRPEGALPPGILGGGGSGGERPWAYTSSEGAYLVAGLAKGEYTAEFRAGNGAALLSARVADTLLRLPDAVLRPTGAVKGRVIRQRDGSYPQIGAYVYIPGLFASKLFSFDARDTVEFVLGDIPAGTYVLRVMPGFTGDLERFKYLEAPALEIGSGDTVDAGDFRLPLRAGERDSAYRRDSAAVAAWLRANGVDESEVSKFSGALGNRIVMLFDLSGTLKRMVPELEILDQVEFLNLMPILPIKDTIDLEDAAHIGRLRGLRQLQLWNCRLDGPPDWLGGLGKLEELVFQGTGLRGFPRELESLPFLRSISMTGDSLGALPGSIANMKRLQVLGLGGAGLDALPDEVAEMPNLTRLYLGANRFASVPRALLGKAGLSVLRLGDNDLSSLPEELMRMPDLKGFHVRGNRLCGLSREWKDWLTLQDSLYFDAVEGDTSFYKPLRAERDSGWEAGQRCPAP